MAVHRTARVALLVLDLYLSRHSLVLTCISDGSLFCGLSHLFPVPGSSSKTAEIVVFFDSGPIGCFDGILIHSANCTSRRTYDHGGRSGPRSTISFTRLYEFLMYNARHNIKAEVRQSGCRYKKWILLKHSGTSYQIIYDAADKIVEEDDTERGGCYISVDRVGEHFYFLRGECG